MTTRATSSSGAIVDDQVTPDTLIANNYVHNMAFMGIRLGGSSDEAASPGDYSGTVVSNNVITDVMQNGHDGGAIYEWNANKQISGGAIIENNYIANYSNPDLGDGKGIYLDDGASNNTVVGNVITEEGPEEATSNALFIHGGINNDIHNNLIDLGSSGEVAAMSYASSPLHPGGMTGNVFKDNTIISDFAGEQKSKFMGVSGYTYFNGFGNAQRGANPEIADNVYHNFGGGQVRTDGNGIGDDSPIEKTPTDLSLEGGWGPVNFNLPDGILTPLQETKSLPQSDTTTANLSSQTGSQSASLTSLPYDRSVATDAALPENQLQARINENSKYNREALVGGINTLFVGDSLTEKQPEADLTKYFGAKTAAFGVGGDQTQNLLYRLQNGELDFPKDSQPEVVVLEIGTNNMGENSAAQTLDGVAANIDQIQSELPDTKFYWKEFIPVEPRKILNRLSMKMR